MRLTALAALLFVPMLVEAMRASRNERALIARGGVEPAGDVYRIMQVAYPAVFVAMLIDAAWRSGMAMGVWFVAGLALFLIGKTIKWWAIVTLGPFWTFRVIVVPGTSSVRTGPYRLFSHPNYAGVIGELVGAALMTGALIAGPVAVVLFSILMLRRVAIEDRARDAILRRSWSIRPVSACMSASVPPSSPTPTPAAVPPAWARALDILCLVLVGLALVVAEWGGFRERLGPIRIALTSPYRLLIAAAGLAVLRHVLSPAAPMYRDIPTRIIRGWRSTPSRTAWGALIGTRLSILFVGYMAVVMFGYRPGTPPLRVSQNEVANLQARWDMAWYFGIATGGYRVLSNSARDQQNIVFFPAYPMLMRVTGRLLGGESNAFVIGGTLVSFAAFFWAMTYLFRIARDMLPDDEHARYAVWLLAAYPFAWFYGAIYTESLFLLGATGAFYHFRRRELVRAGVWGLLVGLTRPNGCFLSIPLAVVAISPWLPAWLAGGARDAPERSAARRTPATLIAELCAAAMPGIGVLLYSAYIWSLTGDPLRWAEGHAAWGREYRGLAVLITDRYAWLANEGLYAYTSQVPADLLNALGAMFVLAAAWPVARRLGLAYAVFILVNILPPMAAGGMLSVGRFSSVLFPVFIWFASVVPLRHRSGWLTSFMAVQAFGAALFYTWHELY